MTAVSYGAITTPAHTPVGERLLTIKDTYTYDDIDTIINLNDILTYKFEQTKREEIFQH